MTWYVYRQNNSGGFFKKPALMVAVEIDAKSLTGEESNTVAFSRAKSVGVDPNAPYCECCGKRWSDHAEEREDRPAADDGWDMYRKWAKRDQVPLALYIHADGTKEEVMP